MTITVVSGLVGKPVEKVTTVNSQSNPSNTQSAVQASQQAVGAQALSSDAVVMNLRSSRGQERSDRIGTYSRAKETTKEVAEKIRDNENGEATEAHKGLDAANPKTTLA